MLCCCAVVMSYQVPPLRPEGSPRSKEQMSWLEEYLEGKDEILLYITAALGVLMPGFVYLLYHKCHSYYERYAKKKEEQRLAEELAESEAVVIVLGKEDGIAAPWAKVIHDKLCDEMVRKPMIWWSDSLNVKELMEFKGFCVFIAETTNGAGFNKVARTLLKRLKIVGSKQITEVELFNTSETDKQTMERFIEFSFELLLQMDKHLPGMSGGDTDDSEAAEGSSSESSSEEEEADEKHKKSK
uniref:Flavodoxin-like domain-containing protein n=1 Tax=Caenorhabditis tropicalis TaxID=1561998 RepID=A0A1I7TMR0_9PELO